MPAGETPPNLMNVPFQSFFRSSLRMTEDTWGALRAAHGTCTTIQLVGAIAWRPDPSELGHMVCQPGENKQAILIGESRSMQEGA